VGRGGFDDRLRKATADEMHQQRNWEKDVVWGRTALSCAAALGDRVKAIVRLLLEKGADPHLRRMIECLTPLQIAENLPDNNEAVVEMLRTAMVNPEKFCATEDSDSEHSSEVSSTCSDIESDVSMLDTREPGEKLEGESMEGVEETH
jgi:hypothetical protein